ncbi:FUSC family protein [Pseudonocardia yuanmonensis]|uniref:FUSC family protein n=1 Tax=Pseudonocardia yuanmonensis TaxID=1095914 RepID=A0ABP8XUP6_9PSEU
MGELRGSATMKQVGLTLLVVLPLFVPDGVIEFTPLGPAAAFVIAGTLPAVIAWMFSPRYAVATIPLAALLNFLAVLVFGHPIATALLMFTIAVLVGLSAVKGLHPVAIFLALQPAITVIYGYPSMSFGQITPGVVGHALICAGVAIGGGLWALLVGAILLREERSGAPDPVPAPVVAFYTGALVILLTPTALIAATWFAGTTAGWVLVSILVAARPSYDESRLMIVERGAGTVVGGLLAGVLALATDNVDVLVVIGTVAMVVAAVVYLVHARYAYFATFLTAAIVLLNAEQTDVLTTDVDRVVYTIAGLALVAAVVALAEMALGRYTPASGAASTVPGDGDR